MQQHLPNFFIVGAPRSGTTSLWSYLSKHPEIHMSYQKEPLFFGSDLTKKPSEFSVLDKKKYLELFRDGADKKIRGEASVMYLSSKKAAEEIYAFNPEAYILIMLRNPIDIVYSHFGQLRWGGYERIFDFESALKAEADRREGRGVPISALVPEALYYSEIGLLGQHVERYLKVFPRNQIKFLQFDDLAKTPSKTYQCLLDFLGVERIALPSYAVKNSHKEPRSLTLSTWLQKPPKAAKPFIELLPHPYRHRLLGHLQGALNTRKVDRKTMDEKTRDCLANHFSKDIKLLGNLLGTDFSHWISNSLIMQNQ